MGNSAQTAEKLPDEATEKGTEKKPGVKKNPNRETVLIHVDLIKPNPDQPREIFNKESLKRLAKTYKRRGDVEEPVAVIKRGKYYMLIGGERRLRAAKMVGIEYISATIRKDVSDKDLFCF